MHKYTVWFLLLTLFCERIAPYTCISQTTTYLQDGNDEEVVAGSRCAHGSPFSSLPGINLCCTPKDGVFDSLITGNLVVTGSAIINNLIVTGTTFLTNLVTDTLCVNGDAVVGGYLTVQNTIDAGYYANNNEAMRVDSHREITNDFNSELIVTPTDVAVGDDFGGAVALDGTGSFAVIGAPSQGVQDDGAVYFYAHVNDTWVLVQKEVGSAPFQSFGRAVAISLHGERIAVAGSNIVTIYGKQGGIWVQEAVLTGPVAEAGYGVSVSLSGDGSRLLVGDVDLDLAFGGVYGYKRIQSTCSPTAVQWVLEQTIVNPVPTSSDFFGAEVSYSADGMVAVIGAPGVNITAGAVYVYERTAQNGLLVQASGQIVPLVPVPFSEFGSSVSVSANGDYFIVGAPSPAGPESGNAYVYVRSNQDWVEQQILTGDPNALLFGYAVNIAADGSLAVVTNVTSALTQLGAATIFARTNTNWVSIQTIPSPFTLDALFGVSASLSQDQSQLLVGSVGQGIVADAVAFYSAHCSVVPSCLRVIGDLTVSGTTTFDNDVIISGTIIGNLSVTGTVFADSVVVTGPSTLVVEGDSYFNDQIKAVAGTAAVPTYTFSGALTSGIYSSGAGSVDIAAAGAQKALATSTGFRYTTDYRADAILTSNQALAIGGNTIIFNTSSYNPSGAYSTGTGIFTAPITGYYLVNSAVSVLVGGGGVLGVNIALYVNGSPLPGHTTGVSPVTAGDTRSLTMGTVVAATAGDALTINIASINATSTALANAAWVSIHLLSI